MEQIVLGRSHPALLGSGVGAGQFGKVEGPLLQEGANQQSERLVFWVGASKGAAALIALRTR
jgi:hypothetical protein